MKQAQHVKLTEVDPQASECSRHAERGTARY
jgi:hypothetical protein